MGFGGQDRRPDTLSARERRNANAWQSENLPFISSSEVIGVTSDGFLTLILASAGGLENVSGELTIKLDTDPILLLSANGLKVDEDELYRLHETWGIE